MENSPLPVENFMCYNKIMQIPLLQTLEWQKFQQDLGKTTFFEQNDGFSYLAIVETTSKIGSYLYLPYGPVARDLKSFKKALNSLQNLAKTQKCFFIRLEPQNQNFEKYLKTTPNFIKTKDLNPKDTWTLDLTPEKATILTNFSQGTRTRYNQFAKKGLSVTTSQNPADIKYLVNLQQKLAKTKKIGTFSEKYLETELKQDFATLYLVHFDSKIIAASLFFDDDTTRYYMQSAADADFKKLPGTVALLSTAIFDAKAKNLQNFDFWGIAPENAPPNHPWAGFTEFKKSFGGTAIHYCGTYDLILDRPKYRFYTLLRQLNRILRKIK